jgi:hypothetical protein
MCGEQRTFDSRVILVALDGVYNTVVVLEWLLEHAGVLKDYQVRLRPHPNVPLEENQCLTPWPANFTISSRPLMDDILESGCVFYRHTSIGLQALAHGKPVVHLAIDCPLPGDPLEDVNTGKWPVRSTEELKAALAAIGRLNEQERTSLKNSCSTLEGYFSPPKEEAMEDFLPGSKDAICLNR